MNFDKMAKDLSEDFVKTPLERSASKVRTAGEIRHVKDIGPVKRQNVRTHQYRAKDLKKLTRILWHLSISLGHLSSGVTQLTKTKGVHISPDGRLGGRGYDKSITDLRKELYGAVEAVSAVQDTLFDEISAEHWKPKIKELPKKDQKEVVEMIGEVEDIRDDPDAFGDEAFQEEVVEDAEEKEDGDFDLPSIIDEEN